ncbi:hypothetical protein GCM10010924_47320 [Rhizobium wenxiniae]|nr:hypothetical protein GCM10010924_47320 [Rhizobium wenxiniae]
MVPLYRIEARRFGKNLQRIGHGSEIDAPMYVFTLVSARIVPDTMRLKAWGFVDPVGGNPRLLAQLDRKQKSSGQIFCGLLDDNSLG